MWCYTFKCLNKSCGVTMDKTIFENKQTKTTRKQQPFQNPFGGVHVYGSNGEMFQWKINKQINKLCLAFYISN